MIKNFLILFFFFTQVVSAKVNQHRLFTYHIPKDWSEKKGFMGSDMVIHAPLVANRNPILIFVKTYPLEISDSEAFPFLLKDLNRKKEKWANLKINKKYKVKNKIFIIETTYTNKKDGMINKGIFSVIPAGKEYVFFMVTSDAQNVDAYRTKIDHFIKSINFSR